MSSPKSFFAFLISFLTFYSSSPSPQNELWSRKNVRETGQFLRERKKEHSNRRQDETGEKFIFPASNSLTDIDSKYFQMIQSEVEWGNVTREVMDEKSLFPYSTQNEVNIDSHGYPESFSLTEIDRQYFNVIKTEDGRSKFYKTVDEKSEQVVKIVEEKMRYPVEVDSTRGHFKSSTDQKTKKSSDEKFDPQHGFRYHIVKTKSSRPIVGIYLPDKN